MEVEVVRSARRRKTVQAHVVEGRLRVHVPARMSRAEETHWVGVMMRRFEHRRTTAGIDLAARARELAALCLLPPPASIRWVDNQEHQWGSCTPDDGTIRISSRMATFPRWVVDYVIVHELAHLVRTPHDAEFNDLVDRYPLAERARGFLIAKAGEAFAVAAVA